MLMYIPFTATPGRLSDLQQNQLLNLKGVTYLVNISTHHGGCMTV